MLSERPSCLYSQWAHTVDKAHLLTIHVRSEPRVLHGSLAVSSVARRSVAVIWMLVGKMVAPVHK